MDWLGWCWRACCSWGLRCFAACMSLPGRLQGRDGEGAVFSPRAEDGCFLPGSWLVLLCSACNFPLVFCLLVHSRSACLLKDCVTCFPLKTV